MKMLMTVSKHFIFIAAIAVIAFYISMPVRSQMLVYPVMRQAASWKLSYDARRMEVYETPHFIIKYDPKDADVVPMVAQAAEKAYEPVTRVLGSAPAGKTLIVMHPDKNKMNKAFGWSGNQSAMGVYWGGVIQILSPHSWLENMSADEFIRSGPMVHEFTHLVFDRMTAGNYPRWFTEGLAQYVEYKTNDYEWRTTSNSMTGKMYSMAELDSNFDNLTDTSLAYREGLAAVRYIAEVHGDAALKKTIDSLKAGKDIKQAVFEATGQSYDVFAKEWMKWAVKNMK